MEPVVQGLPANTSTQMFFSPDPEDADLIRATLNSTVRNGDMTLDLPSLHCWLRVPSGDAGSRLPWLKFHRFRVRMLNV